MEWLIELFVATSPVQFYHGGGKKMSKIMIMTFQVDEGWAYPGRSKSNYKDGLLEVLVQ